MTDVQGINKSLAEDILDRGYFVDTVGIIDKQIITYIKDQIVMDMREDGIK